MVATPKYDLTIYGATGFTGRLAAQYVSNQYGSSIKWAIGGRSEAKLKALAGTLKGSPGVVVADGSDEAALLAMCSQTAAVATCAGPFSRYGTKLVEACVAAGCGYSDITGEIEWVREMIAAYDDKARVSGARIVHLCGHDSVPWDLSAMMCVKKLKAQGEDLVKIDFWDDLKSSPSGGTLETMFGITSGSDKSKTSHAKQLGYDPLLKSRSAKAAFGLSAKNVNTFQPGSNGEAARSFFVMSGVNANAVKRSNALLGYGERVSYCEGVQAASTFGAAMSFFQLVVFGLLVTFPPTRFLMRKYVLPKPGEGPSEEFMATGYLNVKTVAVGTKGSKVKSLMKFKVDPGYKDTARLVVESALTLALDGDKLTCPGGVYTPAACQGEALMDRITATGTTFTYLE